MKSISCLAETDNTSVLGGREGGSGGLQMRVLRKLVMAKRR